MDARLDPGPHGGATSPARGAEGAAAAGVDPPREMEEMHHRFANILQIIRALLARRSRQAGPGSCRAALAEVDAQLHAFSLLHERLRPDAGSRPAAGDPCCAAYLADVCRDLADACLAPLGLRMDFAASGPLRLPEGVCRNLGLLVTELVVNASKHAFRGRPTGIVSVSLNSSEGGSICLTVMDDGIGMPAAPDGRQGEGMGLVEALARSAGARSFLSTGTQGTRYAFELAAPAATVVTGVEALADA